MSIIRPAKIKPSDIISSTAVDTHSPWASGSSYSKGTRVIYDDPKKGPSIYESVIGGNKGNAPDKSPDEWVRVGPINRWALFDGSASTLSESENGFEVSFTVSETFDSIAFFEVYGASLSITIDADGQRIFTHERELIDNSSVVDGYTYFFEPFDFMRDGVVLNVPPYFNATVTITITGTGRTGIGELVVGMIADIGSAEYGATHGIRDYSRIKEDSFGNRHMEQGAWSKKSNLRLFVDKHRHRYVSRILTELRGIPIVFIGSTDPHYEPLIIFGSIKEWQPAIAYPTKTLLDIEIQGLI